MAILIMSALFRIAEIVNNHNIVEIIGVQAAHHTTTDEARGSRNYYHFLRVLISDGHHRPSVCKFTNFIENGELKG